MRHCFIGVLSETYIPLLSGNQSPGAVFVPQTHEVSTLRDREGRKSAAVALKLNQPFVIIGGHSLSISQEDGLPPCPRADR
jgi:hypothetical protein